MARPSLLLLTAAASALAVVANAATLAVPDPDSAAKTRLGNSIEQDINARDSAAAKRKRGLDLREQAAKAAEARIQADLAARQRAAAATAPGGGGMSGSEPGLPAEAQYDELARIYQAMKPAKAALVFEQLDMEVQMKVAQRMRANSTASILASMTPRGAAALSMSLARKSAARPRPLVVASPTPPPARPAAKPPAAMAGR
jgi:flagellar motility protein MotE (MotC chaperone)